MNVENARLANCRNAINRHNLSFKARDAEVFANKTAFSRLMTTFTRPKVQRSEARFRITNVVPFVGKLCQFITVFNRQRSPIRGL